jgi:hypothetical protein
MKTTYRQEGKYCWETTQSGKVEGSFQFCVRGRKSHQDAVTGFKGDRHTANKIKSDVFSRSLRQFTSARKCYKELLTSKLSYLVNLQKLVPQNMYTTQSDQIFLKLSAPAVASNTWNKYIVVQCTD